MLGQRKSASTNKTRRPAAAEVCAKNIATADFPSPGIAEATVKDCREDSDPSKRILAYKERNASENGFL